MGRLSPRIDIANLDTGGYPQAGAQQSPQDPGQLGTQLMAANGGN